MSWSPVSQVEQRQNTGKDGKKQEAGGQEKSEVQEGSMGRCVVAVNPRRHEQTPEKAVQSC